jgi:hypothetical protein
MYISGKLRKIGFRVAWDLESRFYVRLPFLSASPCVPRFHNSKHSITQRFPSCIAHDPCYLIALDKLDLSCDLSFRRIHGLPKASESFIFSRVSHAYYKFLSTNSSSFEHFQSLDNALPLPRNFSHRMAP